MKQDKLAELSLNFGIEIMRLSHWLEQQNERVASYQICKSGTSIGANIRECHYAQSKPDFISKMQIALKEANESGFWLDLLWETDYLSDEDHKRLSNACGELRVILIHSINTAKENLKKKSKAQSQ